MFSNMRHINIWTFSRTCYFILIIYQPFSSNAVVILINEFKKTILPQTKFIRLNFGAYASFFSILTSNGQVLLLGNNWDQRDFLTELKLKTRGFINPWNVIFLQKKKKNLNFLLNCCSWYKKVDYRMGHERRWLILDIDNHVREQRDLQLASNNPQKK